MADARTGRTGAAQTEEAGEIENEMKGTVRAEMFRQCFLFADDQQLVTVKMIRYNEKKIINDRRRRLMEKEKSGDKREMYRQRLICLGRTALIVLAAGLISLYLN